MSFSWLRDISFTSLRANTDSQLLPDFRKLVRLNEFDCASSVVTIVDQTAIATSVTFAVLSLTALLTAGVIYILLKHQAEACERLIKCQTYLEDPLAMTADDRESVGKRRVGSPTSSCSTPSYKGPIHRWPHRIIRGGAPVGLPTSNRNPLTARYTINTTPLYNEKIVFLTRKPFHEGTGRSSRRPYIQTLIMSAQKQDVNFERDWPLALTTLEIILKAFETGQGIKYKEWMNTYNVVFSLAIAQQEPKIYPALAEVFKNFVNRQSKVTFPNTTSYSPQFEIIIDKQDGDLMLREYLKLFLNFTRSAESISKICKYMERYWIPNHMGRQVNNIEVRNNYPLALVCWRGSCFDPIKDKLVPSVLDLLDRDRSGDKQDKQLVRQFVESYIQFDAIGPMEGQQFYEKEFESRYIQRLKSFYAQESTDFLSKNGVSQYLYKAEARIEEEKDNSSLLAAYLSTSEPKIKQALDEVLIEKHLEIIQQDLIRMLKEDKNEDMKRVYFLLSRVASSLPAAARTMNEFLIGEGSKIVADQKDKRDVKDSIPNAVLFVRNLMQFYDKYSVLVSTCFSSNAHFKTALDKAFREIMNQEAGIFNIPRLLNFFIDNVVKGKEKDYTTEEEIDDVLQKLVSLFTYLQDKDEFFEYYRKALCKRLLSKGKQYNENAEKSFLSKLKQQSGDAAIRKLQGMFTDVQDESLSSSRANFEEFNGGTSKIDGVDLEVSVLNESHWPIPGSQKFPLVLTSNLLNCQKKFQTFYEKKGEKRKLQWLYNYGTVTLASRFNNTKLQMQLVLTPLQASILMCFNSNPRQSFEDIFIHLWPTQPSSRSTLTTSTGGSVHDTSLEEVLKYAIQPLVYWKCRVLQKEGESAEEAKKENINNTDVFVLRDRIPQAPGKKLPRKIPFPMGSAKQTQKEAQQDHELVMKQREFEIDAAMVRVLKMRNRIEWNKVQVEVINMLQSRFTPEAKLMKKRLESLIERQFMERDEMDPKFIVYVA
ncbi:hypothetical protein PROFUN_09767 [Planoprotostelium fungivorum]|uniref:Cullin-5 n=1 Tax=Planoprotostelium fungivorum TaxID=1890364 RepID=A0A2P6NFB3_9EUKA|nr:hypothetical protein PROFUN_09767 [Planoprotostelium fungivorum]